MAENLKYEAAKMLVHLERSHRQLLEKSLLSLGIFSGQQRILMYLADRGEDFPSQKEIAETFGISPAAVAVSLKKLEDSGFIQKKDLDKDNRVNNVSLTEKGKEATEKTMAEIKEISESLFSVMSDDELRDFSGFMAKIQESITNFNNK